MGQLADPCKTGILGNVRYISPFTRLMPGYVTGATWIGNSFDIVTFAINKSDGTIQWGLWFSIDGALTSAAGINLTLPSDIVALNGKRFAGAVHGYTGGRAGAWSIAGGSSVLNIDLSNNETTIAIEGVIMLNSRPIPFTPDFLD